MLRGKFLLEIMRQQSKLQIWKRYFGETVRDDSFKGPKHVSILTLSFIAAPSAGRQQQHVRNTSQQKFFPVEPLSRQLCFHGGRGSCISCVSQMFRSAVMALTAVSEMCITNVTHTHTHTQSKYPWTAFSAVFLLWWLINRFSENRLLIRKLNDLLSALFWLPNHWRPPEGALIRRTFPSCLWFSYQRHFNSLQRWWERFHGNKEQRKQLLSEFSITTTLTDQSLMINMFPHHMLTLLLRLWRVTKFCASVFSGLRAPVGSASAWTVDSPKTHQILGRFPGHPDELRSGDPDLWRSKVKLRQQIDECNFHSRNHSSHGQKCSLCWRLFLIGHNQLWLPAVLPFMLS